MLDDNYGWSVAMRAVDFAVTAFDSALLSAYVLGSLGHGGFSASSSDIDIGLVFTHEPKSSSRPVLLSSIGDDLIKSFIAEPRLTVLAGRLSIFHCLESELGSGVLLPESRLPLLDRVDMLTTGVCVYGVDTRHKIAIPTQESVAKAAIDSFVSMSPSASFYDTLRKSYDSNDVRKLCKTILSPIRLAYSAKYGRVVSNISAASWFARELGFDLALTACDWRSADQVMVESYDHLERDACAMRNAALAYVNGSMPDGVHQLEFLPPHRGS